MKHLCGVCGYQSSVSNALFQGHQRCIDLLGLLHKVFVVELHVGRIFWTSEINNKKLSRVHRWEFRVEYANMANCMRPAWCIVFKCRLSSPARSCSAIQINKSLRRINFYLLGPFNSNFTEFILPYSDWLIIVQKVWDIVSKDLNELGLNLNARLTFFIFMRI